MTSFQNDSGKEIASGRLKEKGNTLALFHFAILEYSV
jgi:hypothetical protein